MLVFPALTFLGTSLSLAKLSFSQENDQTFPVFLTFPLFFLEIGNLEKHRNFPRNAGEFSHGNTSQEARQGGEAGSLKCGGAAGTWGQQTGSGQSTCENRKA